MIFLSENGWAIAILALCIVPILLLIGYALIVRIKKGRQEELSRKKEITESEDNTQKDLFFRLYGGVDNIKAVTRESNRLTVQVKNKDKALLEELKETGAQGVLVVNDEIKCNFGDRTSYIYNLIKDYKEKI